MSITTPDLERERTAAATASQWIAELLDAQAPEWPVVARLADELRRLAEDAALSRAATR